MDAIGWGQCPIGVLSPPQTTPVSFPFSILSPHPCGKRSEIQHGPVPASPITTSQLLFVASEPVLAHHSTCQGASSGSRAGDSSDVLITQICAEMLVLFSSAAFFLPGCIPEGGRIQRPSPPLAQPPFTLSLAVSKEKGPQEVLTLMLWRLQKELKLEDNMFSTAVKRNQIPIHLRQCCSELLAEQGASPKQGRGWRGCSTSPGSEAGLFPKFLS